jgi:RND family efflux transporter MFP subunit
LQQAQQQAEAARAQLDIAQRQFDNNRALVAQNFISRTALDNSQANLEGAMANHRAALAAADVARKSLDDTTLHSPIAGLVSQRLAQPGERLPVDARILEIVDTRRMELEASVGAAESLKLKIGQLAQLRLEGSTNTLSARLVRINPSAQAASRSVMAYFRIEPESRAGASVVLRQGLFAQGTLGTGSRQVLAVPVSALRVDKAQPYVQTVSDGRVLHQSVTPGERGVVAGEDMVAVDLPAGTQVLRGSVGALRDGLAVRFTQQTPPAFPTAAPLAKPAP